MGGVLSDQDIIGRINKYDDPERRLVIRPRTKDTVRENGVDLRIVGLEEVNPMFALAFTEEHVGLPADLVGDCNIRSTWARRGFAVPPTIIDAGFQGQVVIELLRFDPTQPWPKNGERLLHVIFHETTTPVQFPYNGKYQGQTGLTRARPDA